MSEAKIEADATTSTRADVLFRAGLAANYRLTSRVFLGLMVVQWVFAVAVALLWSPYAWTGRVQSVHVHVYAAVLLGGAISSLPIVLTWRRPEDRLTRHVVAAAQVLWSALLIHLTGGRIETHFHVFVSLAFLAFYRDWQILVPATVFVAGDHLVRGILWPESVYGMRNPEWWRFLEHALWVAFEDLVLVMACLRGVAEMRAIGARQADAEANAAREEEKARALEAANEELARSRDALARLASVGELAASVAHDLRNPLAAIRNGVGYLQRRANADDKTPDPKIATVLGVLDKEIAASTKLVGDVLDYARGRAPDRAPCQLRPLVDEAIGLTEPRSDVKIVNEVPEALAELAVDRDQLRRVLVNLIQNGADAIPADRAGSVVVRARSLERAAADHDPGTRIEVVDDGAGIADTRKIFEPLFTTKAKGTGLGLAIVSGIVARHGGRVRVESEPGRGTSFIIDL